MSTPGLIAIERTLIGGDLSKLSEQERLNYYKATCESLGLNPLTKPFDYIELNGKLTLYAKRDCTDQLRNLHSISVKILSREVVEGVFVVTAQARTPEGREDESIGAVPVVKEDGNWKTSQSGKRFFEGSGEYLPLKPEDRANAIMKAETKAKRRVTLSICGLGLLDESEFDTIAELRKQPEGPKELPEPPVMLPPELEVLFGKDAPPKAMTTAFEMCRRELMEALPSHEEGETEYRRILDKFGIKRNGGNKVGDVRKAVAACWTMAQSLKKLKQPPAVDLGVNMSDMPYQDEWPEGKE